MAKPKIIEYFIPCTPRWGPLEIEDEVANSNFEIVFDAVTQKASLIEK